MEIQKLHKFRLILRLILDVWSQPSDFSDEGFHPFELLIGPKYLHSQGSFFGYWTSMRHSAEAMFVSLYILMNALLLQIIYWSLCSASFHRTNRLVHRGGHYPSKKAKQLILLFLFPILSQPHFKFSQLTNIRHNSHYMLIHEISFI